MYQDNISALLLLFAIIRPAVAQDPFTVCPKNYRLEFENDSVRVSRAMFAPGDKLPVHDHPAYPTVFVYLTDGGPIRFTHIQPVFTVERLAVKAGAIRFHTGATETHIVEYLGSSASEYLRIELKTERPDKTRQHIRIAADDQKPFENSQLRIARSQCAAQQECAGPEHPAVIVWMNDRSVSWQGAGKTFTNTKDEAVKLIRVELKTNPL
jgi:quercetin dioxygenase-like cupin family protein